MNPGEHNKNVESAPKPRAVLFTFDSNTKIAGITLNRPFCLNAINRTLSSSYPDSDGEPTEWIPAMAEGVDKCLQDIFAVSESQDVVVLGEILNLNISLRKDSLFFNRLRKVLKEVYVDTNGNRSLDALQEWDYSQLSLLSVTRALSSPNRCAFHAHTTHLTRHN